MSVLIDTSFRPTYDLLAKAMPHALLFQGTSGVGLFTIAKSLQSSGVESIVVKPVQKTKTALPRIGVESIRELYEQVKTNAKQLVIIDDAEKMTDTAQNALLKLLEEPNEHTSFILTSHQPEGLLPTVRSRTQSYFVPTVSSEVIKQQIESIPGLVTAKKQQVMFLAGGLPAELHRLTSDDMYFRQRASQIQFVKSLLGATPYEAVAKLNKEKLDRAQAIQVTEDTIRLLRLSPTESSVKRISSLITAHDAIVYGGNPRLQLVRAML